MEKKNDGGPAYPTHVKSISDDEMLISHKGMSLRDYFAGQALAAIMSDDQVIKTTAQAARNLGQSEEDSVAILCYQLSDSLLKERNK